MKVKKLAITLLMIIILIILSTKVEATTGKINSETVRLRKEPNTKSTIIEQLDKEHEVEIIDEVDDWYKIKTKVNGETITGYVSKKLVDTSDTETTTKVEETTETTTPVTSDEIKTENNMTAIELNKTTEIEENKEYNINREAEIKVIPLINSNSIAKITGKVEVVEIINNWCRIENNTEIGWVRIEKLKNSLLAEETKEETVVEEPKQEQPVEEQPKQTETTTKEETTSTVQKINKTGYVKAEGLIVRKEPTTSSEDIDSLSKNDKIEIIGQLDGWYQIKIDGKTGYVSSKYVSGTKVEEVTSRSGSTITQEKVTPMEVEETTEKEDNTNTDSSNVENNTTSNVTGSAIVEYAKKYIGCKYVAGGTSPTTGFDCSGFTTYVFKHFGISLSRSSKGQINDGVAVSKSNLQLGDIVVFNNSGNTAIGHVGIYIGGDNFIHAANPSQGVTITSLSSSYYGKRYVGARRVN